MNIERKYQKSLTGKWCMRFETLHPDGDNYDGVITHIKSEFIILREEEDFDFDGVIFLTKRFIKSIRDGKYEKCSNQIIRENGAIKKLRVPRWLNSCETIPQVIDSMMRREIWPGVEIIFSQGSESAFYLGPITHVGNEQFSIKCYDAAGKWEKSYKLSYDEIFRIEFDSKYCNHFNGFMKSKGST